MIYLMPPPHLVQLLKEGNRRASVDQLVTYTRSVDFREGSINIPCPQAELLQQFQPSAEIIVAPPSRSLAAPRDITLHSTSQDPSSVFTHYQFSSHMATLISKSLHKCERLDYQCRSLSPIVHVRCEGLPQERTLIRACSNPRR